MTVCGNYVIELDKYIQHAIYCVISFYIIALGLEDHNS